MTDRDLELQAAHQRNATLVLQLAEAKTALAAARLERRDWRGLAYALQSRLDLLQRASEARDRSHPMGGFRREPRATRAVLAALHGRSA